MNIANVVTLSRLLLAVVLFFLLWRTGTEPSPGWGIFLASALVFIVAAVSDALDGYLARRLNQVTDFGRIADPTVDKVIVCGSFIFLTATDWASDVLPPWVVVIVVTREFLVTGIRGYLESRGTPFPADWAGKGKMLSQCFTIPGILVCEIAHRHLPSLSLWAERLSIGLVVITVAFTIYSGGNYVAKAARLLRSDSNSGDGSP